MSKGMEEVRQAGQAGAVGSLDVKNSKNQYPSFHIDSSVDNGTGYGQYTIKIHHCDGAKLQHMCRALSDEAHEIVKNLSPE